MSFAQQDGAGLLEPGGDGRLRRRSVRSLKGVAPQVVGIARDRLIRSLALPGDPVERVPGRGRPTSSASALGGLLRSARSSVRVMTALQERVDTSVEASRGRASSSSVEVSCRDRISADSSVTGRKARLFVGVGPLWRVRLARRWPGCGGPGFGGASIPVGSG